MIRSDHCCPKNINYKASNFLWAIFAAMLFTDILMMAWCFTLPKGRRTFHYLSIIILTTASIVSVRGASSPEERTGLIFLRLSGPT